MKHRLTYKIFAAIISVIMLLTVFPAYTQTAEEEIKTADFDGYIVKVSTFSKLLSFGEEDICNEIDGVRPMGFDGYYIAETLDSAVEMVEVCDVEYIEPNYTVHLYDDVDAEIFASYSSANSTHISTMNAAGAINNGYSGIDRDLTYDMGGDGDYEDKIIVAVIDSGLVENHEDIDYSRVLSGKNFIDRSDSTADEQGHGTFVTGVILSTLGNGKGVDGLASGVYILPIKVFNSVTTSESYILSAMNYVTEQKKTFDNTNGKSGANICVLNLSFGFDNFSSLLKTAVDNAISAGIIVICAAGNDGDTTASYPAQNAIGVGSTDADGGMDTHAGTYTQVLSQSNGTGYRNKVWVSSPGTSYTSLGTSSSSSYKKGSGTSYATPQVSALAAIAVSLKNDLTSYYGLGATVDNGNGTNISVTNNHLAFKKLLQETANLTDYNSAKSSKYNGGKLSNGQDTRYGWGVVDFGKMISLLTTEVSVSNCDIKIDGGSVYDGNMQEPTVTVKNGNVTLRKDIDYIVAYFNNVNAGTASVLVKGLGNYTGSVTKTFTINKAEQNLNVQMSQSYIKVGNTVQMTVSGQIGTLSYVSSNPNIATVSSNGVITGVAVGSATVTVKASSTDNYNAAAKTVTVQVDEKEKVDISLTSVDLSSSSYTYDGGEKEPGVTVTHNGTKLTQNTDYTVSYSDNINAGTATVTVSGKGGYIGTVTKIFTINKANISYTVGSYSGVYDGKNHGISLKSQSGSTVTYADNSGKYTLTVAPTYKDVGTYTVKCRIAMDNYNTVETSGTVTVYGIKSMSSTLSVSGSVLKVSDYTTSAKTLFGKFSLLASSSSYLHCDKSNANKTSDNLSTGDRFKININGKTVYDYQVAVSGDVNGDGKISALDYVSIKNHIMNTNKISEKIYLTAADVNDDGKISALDYVQIKNHIMGGK